MEKKEYLSNLQIILLVVFANIADTVFFVPGEAVTQVFQDVWISIIMATVIAAVFTIYPLTQMGMKFPGQTIIQYSEKVVGKTMGKLAGFLLTFYFFQLHAWTLREFSEIGSVFLPETPFVVFFLILAIVAAFAVFQGIEVIGRCAEFIFPLGLMALFLVGMMNVAEINPLILFPVLESDPKTLLKSVQSPLDWLTIGVALGVLTSFAHNPKDLKKIGLVAIGLSGLILTVFCMGVISVFSPGLLGTSNFPLLLLSSYGQLGGFEALIITIWFGWIFVRAALFAYVTCVGIAHLFGLKDYHPIILSETVLATAYSFHQYESFMELAHHFSVAHVYYEIFQLLLPLAIWLVFLVRQKQLS